jgi:integrase
MAEKIVLDMQAPSTAYSYKRYVAMYESFRDHAEHSEDLVLRFLVQQKETMAATSLWTVFSHVKKYLLLECHIDFGKSQRITDFLKTLSRFHKKKKAPSFSREQMFEYLRRASNEGKSLVSKLVLLAGFYGGMRCCELVNLTWNDIVFAEEGVLLIIRQSKTDRAGIGATKLLPSLEESSLSSSFYYLLYKNAVADQSGRLFLNFANGKFTKAPIGKNTIAAIPRKIAEFLGLENPELYTGHSFRVSSATVLADGGASSITLKRHGRWTSDTVAESYLRDSKMVRKETALMLAGDSIKLDEKNTRSKATNFTSIVFKNCVFSAPIALHNQPEKDDKE